MSALEGDVLLPFPKGELKVAEIAIRSVGRIVVEIVQVSMSRHVMLDSGCIDQEHRLQSLKTAAMSVWGNMPLERVDNVRSIAGAIAKRKFIEEYTWKALPADVAILRKLVYNKIGRHLPWPTIDYTTNHL